MGPFRLGARRPFFLALLALILVWSVYLYWVRLGAPTSRLLSGTPQVVIDPLKERQSAFWAALRPILESNAPNCPPPNKTEDVGSISFDANSAIGRPDLTTMSEDDVRVMERAHANFVRDIKNASSELDVVHTPGTRGLVSAAGETYFPVFVTLLRMLRRTGSTLPVEVFMKDAGEYQQHVCEDILPGLGAKCLILGDVMGKAPVEHYQLKVFALLFSSFEEIIWMDADGFPLSNPEELLDAGPFTSTGLVTWPDFWISSASPLYYQISHQEAPPMTARQSSETGSILVSKKTHLLSLLLAAYYNYYGPTHYFRLLSQGAPGQGDKETFLQAATALGAPFYAVREPVQPLGHQKPQGLSGSAMAQADPRDDLALTTAAAAHSMSSTSPLPHDPPRVFFVHANYPRFDAGDNVFGMGWETTPTLKGDGSLGRAWTVPENVLRRFGFDAEKAYWEEIKWVTCSFESVFRTWRRKSGLCKKVEAYWSQVFAEPHEDDPKFTQEG